MSFSNLTILTRSARYIAWDLIAPARQALPVLIKACTRAKVIGSMIASLPTHALRRFPRVSSRFPRCAQRCLQLAKFNYRYNMQLQLQDAGQGQSDPVAGVST